MKRFAVLLLTLAMAFCCAAPAFAAGTIEVTEDVSVSDDYDWTRFQGQNLTLNVYNWGEYISNGSDDSVDVVAAFEKQAWAKTVIVPEVEGALMGTQFGHIFSGGYAAGYYGYKWAEVLDADAFSLFKQKGIFNKEVARSFRDNILSKGGTEDPAELYKRFRGQEPTIDALLKRNGIK